MSKSISSINTVGSVSYNTTTTNGIIGSSATISLSKIKYNVLGKEIEVSGYRNFELALCLALINTNGISFYSELKKQEVSFPIEIEEYLKNELKLELRNKKIDQVNE